MTKMDKQYIEKEYEQAIKAKQSTTSIGATAPHSPTLMRCSCSYGRGTLLSFYRKAPEVATPGLFACHNEHFRLSCLLAL